MKTLKGKTIAGAKAEIILDDNGNYVAVIIPSLNNGKEIEIKNERDYLVETFENIIFEVPKYGGNNKIITPRQYKAFIKKNFLEVGVITQYFRAGIMIGNTLITRAYRCYGAYPFGRKVRGQLTICYCKDPEGKMRIILNYNIYRNQDVVINEPEKEVSFKIRGTLGKTVFSMGIPDEKNLILIEKVKKEKMFPALSA